jgi:AraC-like DNA-binding protein
VLAGQAGDHGVFFLAGTNGAPQKTRSQFEEIAARARAMARRHGLTLHAGGSFAKDLTLAARYRAALANAERALIQGVPVVCDAPDAGSSERTLRKLRKSLAHGIEARPDLLYSRFEQYVEAANAHTGQLESLKHELDAGLERLTEPLLETGALDERSFDEMGAALGLEAARAVSAPQLTASYRQMMLELQCAIVSPVDARQERGIQRALKYIRDHLSENITLTQVSRIAGFAPGYFSKLFKRTQGASFKEHTLALRLQQATEMLSDSRLSVDRVRQLSGFHTRAYFNRAFKRAFRVTPAAYRQRRTKGTGRSER